MRKFWGYYDNGAYKVGCTGSTIYLYDQNDNELAKFKDIKYAYSGAFHPKKNLFVSKSTEGSLAAYDLNKLILIKKIIITTDGGQDSGFAFTPDGRYFYNIESPKDSIRTQLTAYRTSDFCIENRWFSNDKDMYLDSIEFDKETDTCYILGFMRNSEGIFDYGFIGCFLNGEIVGKKKLNERRYEYIRDYKSWQESGFTENALEWSGLKNVGEIQKVSLKDEYMTL